ncbi:MAG: TonB-dependent receptor [Proteobacteria bacterium]|nr:TonB-dependent receptor [Pseudomonadota bacterium]
MTRSRRRKLNKINGLKCRALVRTGIPVASTLLAAVPFAHAQEAGAEAGGLQEVVVTAQKRVENLQDVPISVQVLDNTKLEQLNILDLDDYVKFAPSIAYSRGNGQGGTGAPGQSHIYIRGVVNGGDGNHSGSQPAVGTYLDEQPVTTIDGTPEIHLYDIERIEVLEGPQGTLYGASSESGTVRIITNKPDTTKFAANVTVDGNHVTHGGTGWEVEGFVNIPISDIAAVRLVGWAEHDAGFIDNVQGTDRNACIVNGIRTFPTWDGQPYQAPVTPCPTPGVVGAGAITNAPWAKNQENTVDTRGGRAAIKLDLGPDWTVLPTFMTQKVSTEGIFGYDPNMGDLQVAQFGPDSTQDTWYQAALTIQGKVSDFDITYATAFMKRTNHTLAEYSDYSLFYDRVFGSGASWVGNAGTPIMPQEFVIGDNHFQKWSQELRVSTPAKYFIRATFGGFLQRQLHNIDQQYTMPGYGWTQVQGGPGNPNGFSDFYSIPNLPNTIWLTDEQRVDRDRAIFAQVDWDIVSNLTFTAGARQYWYDNSLKGFFGYSSNFSSKTGMATCFEPAYTVGSPCTNLDTSTAGHGIVPKGTLTWKVTPDTMVYTTFSKGFRPGGVNRIAGINGKPYQPDYLKNYEIGWKTTWFDHRLRWNGAIFREDWKNFQFGFLVPPSITAITNAGNARIMGIENELVFAPTRALQISANFTWLKGYITNDFCQFTAAVSGPGCVNDAPLNAPFLPGGQYAGPLVKAGTDLPQSPKFKGNLIARYTFMSMHDWEPFAQGSIMYQTQVAPNLKWNEQQVIGFQPAYALIDLSGGATHNGTEITAYVSNVADKRAQLTRFTAISPNNDNQVYIIPAQPRTFGIRISQNF